MGAADPPLPAWLALDSDPYAKATATVSGARGRAALFDALARLGGQVFLTGADPAAFADLAGRSETFEVSAEAGVRAKGQA